MQLLKDFWKISNQYYVIVCLWCSFSQQLHHDKGLLESALQKHDWRRVKGQRQKPKKWQKNPRLLLYMLGAHLVMCHTADLCVFGSMHVRLVSFCVWIEMSPVESGSACQGQRSRRQRQFSRNREEKIRPCIGTHSQSDTAPRSASAKHFLFALRPSCPLLWWC